MLKRLVTFVCLLGTFLIGLGGFPAGDAQAILLGNHQLTIDLLGTTQYFEFAEFREYEFPVQGLDWGFRQRDLFDIEFQDPELELNDPLQNRNRMTMSFVGNLDIGLRMRTALAPKLGLEGYVKYTPADLVMTYNGADLSAATFTRYSGVTNPDDPEDLQNWVTGDFPTYHIIRFGANMDYVFLRARANTINLYGALGAGVVSYHMSGDLYVPTDFPDDQDTPSAPEKLSYYLPNDTFLSGNLGRGGIFFIHRMFGINVDFRASYSPFELKRIDAFDTSKNQWFWSASIGYTWRMG